MTKMRIDVLLVEKGLAESRNRAQRLIKTGNVKVDGKLVDKPASTVPEEAHIEVLEKLKYVSRGGHKIEAAVDAFDLQVEGKVCADVGASTGGFTDCLLQNGAERVYAIDVGVDLLHKSLRQDPRIRLMEGTNARYLVNLPEPIDLVTIDASFISIKLILPVVRAWLDTSDGQVVALIKPQFEAGVKAVSAYAGVVKDERVHQEVLESAIKDSLGFGFWPVGLIASPILGPKGNREFLIDLRLHQPENPVDAEWLIRCALKAGRD